MSTRCLLIITIACCVLSGCENPKYSEVPPPTPEPRLGVAPPPTNSSPLKFAGDPKADPVLAAYDRPMIQAIQRRWYKLLDEQHTQGLPQGQVALKFRLHADGTISHVVVAKSTVDAAHAQLAEEALGAAAPFAAWPDEMMQKVKGDYRVVTFSFYYGSQPSKN